MMGSLFRNNSNVVENSAILCPQDWGEAVFKARSLWLQNGGGLDVRWEECFPVGNTSEQNQGKVLQQGQYKEQFFELPDDRIVAYPVPVESRFTLSVPDQYIGGIYRVYNAVGIEVAKGEILQGQTFVDASTFSNGVHFVRVAKENLRPTMVSVVVQKL